MAHVYHLNQHSIFLIASQIYILLLFEDLVASKLIISDMIFKFIKVNLITCKNGLESIGRNEKFPLTIPVPLRSSNESSPSKLLNYQLVIILENIT